MKKSKLLQLGAPPAAAARAPTADTARAPPADAARAPPADAAAMAPVPAVAPADAPHAAADALTPAQAAAARRGFILPAEVVGAIRETPTEARAPTTPYLGGRWTSVERIRCSLCPRPFHYRGKFRCEMPDCGHGNVCNHHSVILCQECFYTN